MSLWVRPLTLATWCVSGAQDGGSYLTMCRGRYSVGDCEVSEGVPVGKLCGACRVEVGLAELAAAPAKDWRPWGVLKEFDTTEEA